MNDFVAQLIRAVAGFRVSLALLLSQYGASVVVGTVAGTSAVVGLCLFGHTDLPEVSSLMLNDCLVVVMLATAVFYIRHPDTLASAREIAEAQIQLAGSLQAQMLSRILSNQRGRILRSQLERICHRTVAP